MQIEFGALAKPIPEQLREQNLTASDNDLKRFEEIAWSIVFLHLQGMIPDSIRDNARKKLMKEMARCVRVRVEEIVE